MLNLDQNRTMLIELVLILKRPSQNPIFGQKYIPLKMYFFKNGLKLYLTNVN